jgi:hypothetical protein
MLRSRDNTRLLYRKAAAITILYPSYTSASNGNDSMAAGIRGWTSIKFHLELFG